MPDTLSFAAICYLAGRQGKRMGGSTGTNFVGALCLADRMKACGGAGAIMSLLRDSGECCRITNYDDARYVAQGIDLAPTEALIAR